jgi:hypothetical protein
MRSAAQAAFYCGAENRGAGDTGQPCPEYGSGKVWDGIPLICAYPKKTLDFF